MGFAAWVVASKPASRVSAMTSSTLRSLLATFNKDTGMGQANRGRYSNPELDKTLAEALRTVDAKVKC